MEPNWTAVRLEELELADRGPRGASRFVEDKMVEVLYLASQYQYDPLARLEAIRDACEEVGWSMGSA